MSHLVVMFASAAPGLALDMTVVLLQLALIVVVARLAGMAVARVGIPPVVGEIAAGVLLGPSLLGVEFSNDLFPIDQRGYLEILAQMGLVLFMFVVGLELDVSLVKGRGKVAGSVSVSSIVLPFALGIGLAHVFVSVEATEALKPDGADFWPFALFMGAAMSITAFPVLARILTDRRMHRTETGGLALACAASDDVIAWTLLAVVLAISGVEGEGHLPSWAIYLSIPFVLVAILVVRPALTWLTRAYHRAGELTPTILSVVLIGMLVFAATTEALGIHFIFGAFVFGAIIPHENAAALRHEILVRLEQISVLLLLPVFFLISGLKVNIQGLGAEHVLPLLAILAVAIIGKYVGAYVGARLQKVPHWQASSIGLLMNTRGLTELIILNVGLQKRTAEHELFTMMVIMALVTTVMTGPLLAFTYPQRRVARDIAEAERAALGDEAVDRILVLSRPGRRQRGAGRDRGHHARRRPAGRDRHRRSPAAGQAARPGQRPVRRAGRHGGGDGEPAGAGAAGRGARRPRPGDRPSERRRRAGPGRAGAGARAAGTGRVVGRPVPRCRAGRSRLPVGRHRRGDRAVPAGRPGVGGVDR